MVCSGGKMIMNHLEGAANAIVRENKKMYSPDNSDRRNGVKRVGIARPLIFSHFNSSKPNSEHRGLIHNQDHLGGCFAAMIQYPIGTILVIRRDFKHVATAEDGNELMENPQRITALAEVRWCMPVENENPKAGYKIGIRYL